MLSEQLITKYQELHRKHFGEEITEEQALGDGLKLVQLIEIINSNQKLNEYERKQEKTG